MKTEITYYKKCLKCDNVQGYITHLICTCGRFIDLSDCSFKCPYCGTLYFKDGSDAIGVFLKNQEAQILGEHVSNLFPKDGRKLKTEVKFQIQEEFQKRWIDSWTKDDKGQAEKELVALKALEREHGGKRKFRLIKTCTDKWVIG